jgi:hypothetical protein
VTGSELATRLREHASRHSVPGAALGVLRDGRAFLLDPDDPAVPTTTFGEFDDGGRPHVLYQMLWGLPRV